MFPAQVAAVEEAWQEVRNTPNTKLGNVSVALLDEGELTDFCHMRGASINGCYMPGTNTIGINVESPDVSENEIIEHELQHAMRDFVFGYGDPAHVDHNIWGKTGTLARTKEIIANGDQT